MEFNFSGKSVLVTGSSRGIGKEIAKQFIDNDAEVVLNGINSENLNKVTHEFKIEKKFAIKADVTQFEQAQKLLKEAEILMKKIDIIICNVGSGDSVKPGEEDYSEWQRVFHRNLWSTTNIVEAGRSALKKTRGIFICISSICGHEVIENAPITYSTAKSALNFYIKAISKPLSKDNIRINGVSPGNVLFKGSSWEEKIRRNPNLYDLTLKDVPLKRFGTVNDIAKMCLWIASDNAAFCNGSIVVVDGGQLKT